MCENPRETTQAVDDIVWERREESKDGNGTGRRLPWRNRGESSDCTKILQHVWFFRVTIESGTETWGGRSHRCGGVPGVLRTERKHVGKWRGVIEAGMSIRHGETCRGPSGARCLVGSALAPMCRSGCPVHFVTVDVESARSGLLSAGVLGTGESVRGVLRVAQQFRRAGEELESMLGGGFVGCVSESFSDFEKRRQRGSTVADCSAVDESDGVHRVVMGLEPLLEASGGRNWRSIMLTHDGFPCHCLLRTWRTW